MSIRAHHFTAGARERDQLVEDDDDRHALLESVRRALGPRTLGYCVMNTHLHVVAEGAAEDAARRLEHELAVYTRAFNRRHGRSGRLLRGPVAWAPPIETPRELSRALHYVHENPLQTRCPLAAHAHEYPWSSRRAYSGLSLATLAHVERGRELLGSELPKVAGPALLLADARPVPAPTAGLAALLGAAAQVYGVPPGQARGRSLAPEVKRARSLFVQLARLEAFSLSQVGGFLGRDKSACCRLATAPHPERAIRIARTLLREPALRARLPSSDDGESGHRLRRAIAGSVV